MCWLGHVVEPWIHLRQSFSCNSHLPCSPIGYGRHLGLHHLSYATNKKATPLPWPPHSRVPFYSLAGGNARRFSGGEVARSGDGAARRLKAAVYFLRALIAALRRCATQRPRTAGNGKLFRAERLHRFESKLRGGQGLVLPQWRKAPAPRSRRLAPAGRSRRLHTVGCHQGPSSFDYSEIGSWCDSLECGL